MKYILLIFAALLFVPAACAADTEPTIYENEVLAIKFYDVSDLRKYKGDNKELAKLADSLKRAKIKSGVVLINRIENVTNNKYGMARQYACVVKLGSKKISKHTDVDAFTKKAEAGKEYDLEYYAISTVGNWSYSNETRSMSFAIKPTALTQK